MLKVDGYTHSKLLFHLAQALNEGTQEEVAASLGRARKMVLNGRPSVALPDDVIASARGTVKVEHDLSQAEIDLINAMLPWSSFIVDEQGRVFGNRYNEKKRAAPDGHRDRRVVELVSHVSNPAACSVAEYGCFEGNHTSQLCDHFGEVHAIDGRVENCLKTMVRCWLLGKRPHVHCINLENGEVRLPEVDVVHHVGVLYHLTRPVDHMMEIFRGARQAVLLDTQISGDDEAVLDFTVDGITCRARPYVEKDVQFNPFAGMVGDVIWLTDDTIKAIAAAAGFKVAQASIRTERNGPRGSYIFTRS